MSQSFRLINEHLSSNKVLSDTTIAVVTSMTVYDRLYRHPEKATVHLDGVSRMIALRGGITELVKRNPVIAQKVFR